MVLKVLKRQIVKLALADPSPFTSTGCWQCEREGRTGVTAMNQSVRPPQALFVRPKSAGSIRSRPPVSCSLAPAERDKEIKVSTPFTLSISIAPSVPSRPIRPLNKPRRPSSAIGSRRCFIAASASEPPITQSTREKDGASMYHVVVARKDAEDAAEQLARRIAHFRAQEERVLLEMQTMRHHLETTLTKPHQKLLSTVSLPLRLKAQHSTTHGTETKQTRMPASSERRLKVPRSREQLEFVSVRSHSHGWKRQKQALKMHKLEAARHQRERRKQALDEQKAKQAKQEHQKRCRNERIRAEMQQVLNQRQEKKRQLREEASKQQYERLKAEKKRQHEALGLVAVMEEEERNLRQRLEALDFHRKYMQQELRGPCSSCATSGSG